MLQHSVTCSLEHFKIFLWLGVIKGNGLWMLEIRLGPGSCVTSPSLPSLHLWQLSRRSQAHQKWAGNDIGELLWISLILITLYKRGRLESIWWRLQSTWTGAPHGAVFHRCTLMQAKRWLDWKGALPTVTWMTRLKACRNQWTVEILKFSRAYIKLILNSKKKE